MSLQIVAATAADVPAIVVWAEQLFRRFHGFDAVRFDVFEQPMAPGFTRFYCALTTDPEVLIAVVRDGEARLGYVYARHEPRKWDSLIDEAVWIHDIVVDEQYRGRGVAKLLVAEVERWAAARNLHRVLITTAPANAEALALFGALGFRTTLVEMMKVLPATPEKV